MGRLQKKKPIDKKRKNGVRNDGNGAEASENGAIVPESSKNTKIQTKPGPKSFKSTKIKKTDGKIGKALQFFREVKVELEKVTWPTKQQTMGSTAVVIVLVMIISMFLGIVDFGLTEAVRFILQ